MKKIIIVLVGVFYLTSCGESDTKYKFKELSSKIDDKESEVETQTVEIEHALNMYTITHSIEDSIKFENALNKGEKLNNELTVLSDEMLKLSKQ